MKIQKVQAASAAAALAALVGVGLFATPAAQAQRDRRNRRQNEAITRTDTIPWSTASGRPSVRGGKETGFYIWHDKNTIHIMSSDRSRMSSDRSRGRDVFSGTVEIQGRNGGFDSLRNEYNEKGDRFQMSGNNRINFRFDTHQSKDGFAANIHDGDRVVFHLNRDGHKTGRIFYGSGQAEANGDPVVFDLHR